MWRIMPGSMFQRRGDSASRLVKRSQSRPLTVVSKYFAPDLTPVLTSFREKPSDCWHVGRVKQGGWFFPERGEDGREVGREVFTYHCQWA